VIEMSFMRDDEKIITHEDIERLEDIEYKICELAREAFDIIQDTSEEGRSKAYWYGEVCSAMNGDTYVESSCSLHSVIEALEEYAEDGEDDDDDDDDDDNT
jgi:hypothetical protein